MEKRRGRPVKATNRLAISLWNALLEQGARPKDAFRFALKNARGSWDGEGAEPTPRNVQKAIADARARGETDQTPSRDSIERDSESLADLVQLAIVERELRAIFRPNLDTICDFLESRYGSMDAWEEAVRLRSDPEMMDAAAQYAARVCESSAQTETNGTEMRPAASSR